jgi:hypothetical protein
LPVCGRADFWAARNTSTELAAPPLAQFVRGILVFLLLNIEIADYFSIGPTLTFPFRAILPAT